MYIGGEIMIFLVIFFIVFILLYILKFFFYAKIKGDIGEQWVIKELSKLNFLDYYRYNNLLIQTERGSSQIDHVVVSKKGIFVIETKNFSGYIYGNEKSKIWKKYSQGRRFETKFNSPIFQNYGHIKALKEKLPNINPSAYKNIVVFVGDCKFKVSTYKHTVVYLRNLLGVFHESENEEDVFTDEQMNNIISTLESLAHSTKEDFKNHKRQVKQIKSETTLQENEKSNELKFTCPRCGSPLIIKHGRNGAFYACTKYPLCKYTRNLFEK